MLVLARQLNERIVMPTVPATIEVVAIKPNGVRLGIEAPMDVTILREEVLRRGGVPSGSLLAQSESDAEVRLGRIKHLLGNRLQGVALGLDLIRQQIDDSGTAELRSLLQRIDTELRLIDEQVRAVLSSSVEQSSAAEAEIPCLVVSPPILSEVEGERRFERRSNRQGRAS
jgi:carbon storage regulator CsrA